MSALENYRWKKRAMLLLRKTTRPESLYPGSMLNGGERRFMEACIAQQWTPKQFAKVLFDRDKLEQSRCLPQTIKGI